MRMNVSLFVISSFLAFAAQAQNEVQKQETKALTFESAIHVSFGAKEVALDTIGLDHLKLQVVTDINNFRDQIRARGVNLAGVQLTVRSVVIDVHTDSKGKPEVNLALSRRRAQQLESQFKDILKEYEIDDSDSNYNSNGWGEEGSEDCSRQETICKKDSKPVWIVKNLLLKINDLILPTSHATSLMDLILGDDTESHVRRGTRRKKSHDGYGLDELNSYDTGRFPPAPKKKRQCKRKTWDEACLEVQRYASIVVVYSYKQKSSVPSEKIEKQELADPSQSEDQSPVSVEQQDQVQQPVEKQEQVPVTVEKPVQKEAEQVQKHREPPRLMIYGKPLEKQ